MNPTPNNLLTVWSELLLDALACAGVRHVVASPGSRSTPFLLAAARDERLTVHSVVDERAAAFFALGLARVEARPPLLLCTSGTAPAHYFPALIEASEAELPLVVLSADRPRELSRAGAPQTTDQVRLYGTHARFFADLGEPDASDAALRGLASTIRCAVETALGPTPGPVHLNARARKPLEPITAETDAERALEARARSIRPRPALRTTLRHDPRALESVIEALARAERPALFAGPLPPEAPREAVLEFARRAGITLLAEATSQLRFGPREAVPTADAFEHWLGTSVAPDVLLEIGATPTTGTYLRWLDGRPPVRRFVLGGSRARDPSGTAEAVILGDIEAIFAELTDRLPHERRHEHSVFEAIDADAWRVIERVLAAESHTSEATALRRVVSRLPGGAWLGLGNSLPIRHADRYVRGGGAPLRVLSQRGVNGIDGWIAASAGAAMASGEPTVVVLGDVAFNHDVGSLALAAAVKTPLLLVVLDNAGGRIFEQLPVARTDVDMTLFTTPPALDLELATRAFGVRYAQTDWQTDDADTIDEETQRALAHAGATVLRIVVPPRGASEQLAAMRGAWSAS